MSAGLNDAMGEFRAFRRTLSPASQAIETDGLIGRLLFYIPEDKAVQAIRQSIQAWKDQSREGQPNEALEAVAG